MLYNSGTEFVLPMEVYEINNWLSVKYLFK